MEIDLLLETIEDNQGNITLSKHRDAKTARKFPENSFFGCKTHLVMIEDYIITAVVVTLNENGHGV